MNSTRLARAGYAAAVAVALCLVWFGYTTWRHHFGRISFPHIDEHRPPAERLVRRIDVLPSLAAARNRPLAIDVRGGDVSQLDLRTSAATLRHAVFDTATRWPAANKMPPTTEFDPPAILAAGRNPGLGVRRLHAEGITGRNIGIAFIDAVLPTGHREYKERLRLYEETSDIYWPWNKVDSFRGTGLHGPAVVSIAAGSTVGVAPEADVYYIATNGGMSWFTNFARRFGIMVKGGDRDQRPETNYAVIARGLRRLVAVNRQLPAERKIRIVSMSLGWNPKSEGHAEMDAAAAEAKAAGLFVVSSNLAEVHGMRFQGLGRDPRSDSDAFESYVPGNFWADNFAQVLEERRLLVPMDARTTAGFSADAEYVFYPRGGWSWAIPYIAGVYALAAQVKPDVTPDEFWATAMKTARTVDVEWAGKRHPLGPIIDPVALIRALRQGPAASVAVKPATR